MKYPLTIIGILILFTNCNGNYKLQYEKTVLDSNWTFSALGKNQFHRARVPGSVHMDLYRNKIIEDPFYELNEMSLQWIEETNWEYKTTFDLDDYFLLNENISLNFNGLDTYADIYLNDSLILSSNNMFRSWELDVKDLLVTDSNELKIVFESPVLRNKNIVDDYPFKLPSGNEPKYVETKTSNFTRKAAYQFGWDWGPRFVTMGIWKPVELIGWNYARIVDVFTQTNSIKDSVADLTTDITLEVSTAGNFIIGIDSLEIKKYFDPGLHHFKYPFQIKNPQLWWVNNMGESYLYKQNISLDKGNENIHKRNNCFGVRTVELINEPDSIGTSFYIKLNNSPIFIKGANYIPQDVFLSRVTPKHYERLIIAAIEANFNM